MASVWWSTASTMLLTAPELRTKNHGSVCSIDLRKFAIDSIIAWSFFTVIPGDSFLNGE
jgi:hypothetical protein